MRLEGDRVKVPASIPRDLLEALRSQRDAVMAYLREREKELEEPWPLGWGGWDKEDVRRALAHADASPPEHRRVVALWWLVHHSAKEAQRAKEEVVRLREEEAKVVGEVRACARCGATPHLPCLVQASDDAQPCSGWVCARCLECDSLFCPLR